MKSSPPALIGLNFDFVPNLNIDNTEVETLEEMRLLGIILKNDLSWKSNTNNMVIRAYKKLWILKRLKKQGANLNDLVDIYTKQVRSILEFGVPVWNSGLTQEEVSDIERVQKSFLYIALGSNYCDYKSALQVTNLDTLINRRLKLCKKFAFKSSRHPKHSNWFVESEQGPNTRSIKDKYKTSNYRLTRTRKGPITYLTKLLNTMQHNQAEQ